MSALDLSPERRQLITKYSTKAKRRLSATPNMSDSESAREGPELKKLKSHPFNKPLSSMNPPDGIERPKSSANRARKSNTPTPTPEAESKKSAHKRTPSTLSNQARASASPSLKNIKLPKALVHSNSPEGESSRVRRSEAERIQYFNEDENCGVSEPNRAECLKCGKFISLGKRQTYAVRPWEIHRTRCDKKNGGADPSEDNESEVDEDASTVAPSIASAVTDVSKRKTEAERKSILETDPRAEEVKPNEVLCRKCQKWIKLSKSSSFALYNWTSHQSRCSDSEGAPSLRVTVAERKLRVINDPLAKKLTPDTVECNLCDGTIAIEPETFDLAPWEEHKASCPMKSKVAPPPSVASSTEATLAVPEASSEIRGMKRAREEDEGPDEDARPAKRSSLLDRFLVPVVNAFTKGFKESLSTD